MYATRFSWPIFAARLYIGRYSAVDHETPLETPGEGSRSGRPDMSTPQPQVSSLGDPVSLGRIPILLVPLQLPGSPLSSQQFEHWSKLFKSHTSLRSDELRLSSPPGPSAPRGHTPNGSRNGLPAGYSGGSNRTRFPPKLKSRVHLQRTKWTWRIGQPCSSILCGSSSRTASIEPQSPEDIVVPSHRHWDSSGPNKWRSGGSCWVRGE